MPSRDPRSIITPNAFAVAPELLGRPLARSWRRGAAMGADMMLVTLLSNAPGVLFGLAAAIVLLRVSARRREGGIVRRSLRTAARGGAAFLLFVVLVSTWGRISSRQVDPAPVAHTGRTISGAQGVRAGVEVMELRRAADRAEARSRADRMATRLRGDGWSTGEIAELMESSVLGAEPWVQEAVAEWTAPAQPGELSADSLVAAYAAALQAGDSAGIAGAREPLARVLAEDTLGALAGRIERLEARSSRLQAELREARERRGVLAFLRETASDFGLGVSWAGLYFTAFLVLWRGQTPGKRLLGIRVLRLGGEPLTWWAAFGRFGGYAAGFATGLLGFFQILWDANRQAVHDKISQTVVIRVQRDPSQPSISSSTGA